MTRVAHLDDPLVAAVAPRSGGVLFDPPADADTCVRDGLGHAYVVARERGEGTVVSVGGSGMFVNDGLADGENAPVVAALVAPAPGTRVVVLEPGPLAGASGGDRTLVDLIPTGVGAALAQLVVAFVVYALWRARRLPAGRRARPVAVAGSELVVAVGNLLDRSRSTDRAGGCCAPTCGASWPSTSACSVGPAVRARPGGPTAGIDHDTLLWALSPGPVADDGAGGPGPPSTASARRVLEHV